MLENGLSIPYDEQHDGYSVFLSTALPRYVICCLSLCCLSLCCLSLCCPSLYLPITLLRFTLPLTLDAVGVLDAYLLKSLDGGCRTQLAAHADRSGAAALAIPSHPGGSACTSAPTQPPSRCQHSVGALVEILLLSLCCAEDEGRRFHDAGCRLFHDDASIGMNHEGTAVCVLWVQCACYGCSVRVMAAVCVLRRCKVAVQVPALNASACFRATRRRWCPLSSHNQ